MGICKGRSAAQSEEDSELEVKEYDLTLVDPDAYGRSPLCFCGFLFKALSARMEAVKNQDMVMALSQGMPSYLPILGLNDCLLMMDE